MNRRPAATEAELRHRHAVVESGRPDGRPLLFAHGYGTSQAIWRHVAPAFADRCRVILFDHVGAGASDAGAWDPLRHGSLEGYAADVSELVRGLDLHDVVYVGHSVGGMIGALAVARDPDRYERLVLVAPSARFLDDDGYVGGFSRDEIEALLETLETDYAGWATAMAPRLVGDAPRDVAADLAELLLGSSRLEGRAMARAFLLADHRADLAAVSVPALVMQSPDDPFVPEAVTRYVERRLPDAHLVNLRTTGHFPVLTAPDEVIAAIRSFLGAG